MEQIAKVQKQNEEIKNSLLDVLEGDTRNTLIHYNLPLNIDEDRQALERILTDDGKKYALVKQSLNKILIISSKVKFHKIYR